MAECIVIPVFIFALLLALYGLNQADSEDPPMSPTSKRIVLDWRNENFRKQTPPDPPKDGPLW